MQLLWFPTFERSPRIHLDKLQMILCQKFHYIKIFGLSILKQHSMDLPHSAVKGQILDKHQLRSSR